MTPSDSSALSAMPEERTSPHPPTRDIQLSPRHRWRAYWIAVSVAALTILDLTKVNVNAGSLIKRH